MGRLAHHPRCRHRRDAQRGRGGRHLRRPRRRRGRKRLLRGPRPRRARVRRRRSPSPRPGRRAPLCARHALPASCIRARRAVRCWRAASCSRRRGARLVGLPLFVPTWPQRSPSSGTFGWAWGMPLVPCDTGMCPERTPTLFQFENEGTALFWHPRLRLAAVSEPALERGDTLLIAIAEGGLSQLIQYGDGGGERGFTCESLLPGLFSGAPTLAHRRSLDCHRQAGSGGDGFRSRRSPPRHPRLARPSRRPAADRYTALSATQAADDGATSCGPARPPLVAAGGGGMQQEERAWDEIDTGTGVPIKAWTARRAGRGRRRASSSRTSRACRSSTAGSRRCPTCTGASARRSAA